MAGLLQQFEVSSDDLGILSHAVEMPFVWHKKAVAYKLGRDEGFDWIELHWCDADTKTMGAVMLPYPLDTPAKAFNFLMAWLDSAERGQETDTDGSVSRGWKIDGGASFYSLCRVTAAWIVYGK